jgi:hypothetical protein
MARKKTSPVPRARITVLISFNGMYKGDTAVADYDDTVCAWDSMGLVRAEMIDGGKSPARPSSVEQDDPGRVAPGTGSSVPAGGEQGEDPGAGGHGPFESVDPS